MIIAVDFDGTCVTHEYPRIGKEIGAVPVLKRIVENGNRLILWTMRSLDPSSFDGDLLEEAVEWFRKHEIELWGVNKNPEQSYWSRSPKAYAHIYIDDAGIGVPLVAPKEGRPYVNWKEVEKLLEKQGAFNK